MTPTDALDLNDLAAAWKEIEPLCLCTQYSDEINSFAHQFCEAIPALIARCRRVEGERDSYRADEQRKNRLIDEWHRRADENLNRAEQVERENEHLRNKANVPETWLALARKAEREAAALRERLRRYES